MPVAVTGLSDAISIAAGEFHTCVVRATGTVVCWGRGESGQLGDGNMTSSTVPVTVSGVSDAVTVAGDWGQTCAVRRTGETVCWGVTGTAADHGNLGRGDSAPVSVPGLTDVLQITAGETHTCALRATGGVLCWGDDAGYQIDAGGQRGNGSPWKSTIPVSVLGLSNAPCSSASDCTSSFCVDGVCCDSACGGGDPNDCQACSLAAGAASNGTCGPRASGALCRASAGACDVAESCTGASLACPPDGFATAGASCGAPGICETAGTCGGGPLCSGPTPITGCAPASVPPGCDGSCDPIELRGGLAVENGITVEFQGGASAGQISVTSCNATSPPPSGYKIVQGATGNYCWDLKVSASVSYTTPPPIIVCIHYPEAIAANEAFFQMAHDDGSGVFAMNTTDRFPDDNTIYGFAYSLSPFALVLPVDTTPPVFSNVPAPLTVFATATTGAKVTYALPKAIDAVDGLRPVICSPASGTTFPVGKTPVTCTAADKTDNVSAAAFTVWVQYQAPTDGTFFLAPIRANGSSIFVIGKAVPVKFKLTGASAAITNLVATLVVTKISNSILGTVTDVGDEDGEDTDFLFKYRPGAKTYGYRWKTLGQTQGTYQLRADLGDGVQHQINVSLRSAK
ncbi:MAG TPA: PxKF domain-containing protein [Polyangia bacterium]|nr:PxKF domain-containing protein [Polyangia bacterium]